ncbi:MAG: orotate phosphoribosyltransferase, partial [Cardiobacteriaceae bacterium]|nr:orotate phosphoribosyltransferase [Cardiobacteriaceae bacterium]
MLAVYQKRFLQTALAVNALQFGSFTLKSGRQSPYFFNAGAFCNGEALTTMAQAYAHVILRLHREGIAFDALYGPAYKGIPLVAAVTTVLQLEHGLSLPWTFNRKESKTHGEGGNLVGAPLANQRV